MFDEHRSLIPFQCVDARLANWSPLVHVCRDSLDCSVRSATFKDNSICLSAAQSVIHGVHPMVLQI